MRGREEKIEQKRPKAIISLTYQLNYTAIMARRLNLIASFDENDDEEEEHLIKFFFISLLTLLFPALWKFNSVSSLVI